MAFPGIGAAIAGGFASGAAGGLFGGLFGGGGSSGAASIGEQIAAQNSPLTAAYQGLSLMQGALAGAIGQEGTTKASAQLSILTEGLQRALKDANLQAAVSTYGAGKGLDTLYNLGQGRLSTELQAPQLMAQAGSASLAGENQLAMLLGTTNIGLKEYQEKLRGNVAADQGLTMNDVFQTRAENEGKLALGTQQFESAANLDRVRTLGDLARRRADVKGQLALKQFGVNKAIEGLKMFA